MRRRSNLLVIIGVVTFVLGLVAVYVITSDDDDSVASASGSDTVEVLVAADALTAGTRGDDVVSNGGVVTERINRVDLQADALVTPSQLSNTVLTLNFSEGEQIRSSGLRSLGGPRAQIPEGFEAVAVDIELVAAGANTIIPGDRVNIYMVAPEMLTGVGTTAEGETVTFPTATPRTELLLTNTLVLDVQPGPAALTVSAPVETATAAAPAPTSGTLLVVLAVDTEDAEKVIFTSTSSGMQLYLSRVRLDDEGNAPAPAGPTSGIDAGSVLAEEADAAFGRSNG